VKSRADGSSTLFVPQLKTFSGLRWAPPGDLYVGTDQGLEKIASNGARTLVLSSINDFNGIEVDGRGRIYAGEFNGKRIVRYDPQTNQSQEISKNVIEMPNGLTFNPTFDTLFVSNWGGHDPPTLHRIAIHPDGTPGKTEVWLTGVGTGVFDGMAADACGNILRRQHRHRQTGEILRFTPDGKTHTVLVKRPARPCTISCGAGARLVGEQALHRVAGKGLFEADPGVRGKKYWYRHALPILFCGC
jgi:sugar lactone lactonase YvrE